MSRKELSVFFNGPLKGLGAKMGWSLYGTPLAFYVPPNDVALPAERRR